MAEVELASGVASLPRDEWNALVADESPFLEWDWLASLEEAGTLTDESGWLPHPLVVRDGGRLIAACPLYVKGHSQGEFVFDWGWADAAERAGIRYYPKLLVGIPFTPVTGARFLVAADQDRALWTRRIAVALRELCTSRGLSSVHVNFCTPGELPALEASGFLPRIGIQYHWQNDGYTCFEDYLARFRSKRRNQIRRERRQLEESGVRIEAFAGDAIPNELFEPMFEFYLSTVESRYWGRQYLNLQFFELVRQRYRERLLFIAAFQGDEPIAGTFNVVKGSALYGRYWGAARYVRHLHFNVCYYAAIEYCIRTGLSRFEPGAGGDYKQLRGFDAQPTYSAHFLAEARLADAVEHFLEQERAQAGESIEWIRDHSALKPAGS
jgi:predicted N-acyltransferase